MSKHGKREDGGELVLLQCRLCDYTTTSTDTLRKHYKSSSHYKEGAKMYNCDFECHFSTDNLHQFKSHAQRHFATRFEANSYVENYFRRI